MIEIINFIRKYNFGDGNPLDLGYIRTFYTGKIGKYVGNKLVKVLVGQRRAGKSYILNQFISIIKELKGKIYFISIRNI